MSKITKKENDLIGIQINRVIEVFYKTINPTINFGNKTSRAGAEFLIKKFGFEKTMKMAETAVKIAGETYAPVITTPYQLKENLAKLAIYVKRNNNSRGTTIDDGI